MISVTLIDFVGPLVSALFDLCKGNSNHYSCMFSFYFVLFSWYNIIKFHFDLPDFVPPVLLAIVWSITIRFFTHFLKTF